MRNRSTGILIALLAVSLLLPAASAHESYDIGDGEYTLTVGDQNEPIYTFKWTNLDLIIRDSNGDPVALDEDELAALDARLEAPGGEMLDRPLEGQFGEEGRYEFEDGHYYTQPGTYTLHLNGSIEGVDATGTYDLPGPRQSFSGFGFPHEDVPTNLDLHERVEAVEEGQDTAQLEQRIQELESQLTALESELETLRQDQQALQEQQNDAPGLGLLAALAALAAVAVLRVRRPR